MTLRDNIIYENLTNKKLLKPFFKKIYESLTPRFLLCTSFVETRDKMSQIRHFTSQRFTHPFHSVIYVKR